ncbi:MAG: vitamin K epoxide reductase family protein [Vulcanimicrobiaceae bacterium]
MPVVLVLTVFLLCAAGCYASAFMANKARRAARGELTEVSVVQLPFARLVGGIPNAAFGLIYYPCVALAVALNDANAYKVAFAASLLAAAMSLVLAYSLLFRTRRPCPYCWTAHAINWLLPGLLWRLLTLAILR